MLIVGLVLIGVSILGGIIAVVAFTVSSFSKLEDFASSTHSIDQHVTVDGLGDHQWFIYQDPNVMTGASCTVLDEQGNDVTTHSADLNMTFNDLSFQAIQTFESSAGGVYDISCTDYPVILGGALPLGGIFGAGISGLVAGLVFLVGPLSAWCAARNQSVSNTLHTEGPPTPVMGQDNNRIIRGHLRDPHDATPIHYTITSSRCRLYSGQHRCWCAWFGSGDCHHDFRHYEHVL